MSMTFVSTTLWYLRTHVSLAESFLGVPTVSFGRTPAMMVLILARSLNWFASADASIVYIVVFVPFLLQFAKQIDHFDEARLMPDNVVCILDQIRGFNRLPSKAELRSVYS